MRIALTVAMLASITLLIVACGGPLPTATAVPAAPTATSTAGATAAPTIVPAAATATPTSTPAGVVLEATSTPTARPTSTPVPIVVLPTATPVAGLPTPTPTPRQPTTPTPTLAPGAPLTLTLEAVADATIWQGAGTIASGSGAHLYAGSNNQGRARRVLMRFDLTGVPAGLTVMSASVDVTVNKVPPAAATPTFALHRLTADWGEGTSDSGGRGGQGTLATTNDATWTKTFTGGASWSSQGGDFVVGASGESSGATWDSTAMLVADVQAWADDAAANHGWIMVETTLEDKSVRRISSREASQGPTLTVTFTVN